MSPVLRTWCLLAAGLLLAWRMPAALARENAPLGEPARLRLVFSSRMFTEVQENDAKAAVRAWAEAFTRERDIRAELDPKVVDGLPGSAVPGKSNGSISSL